MTPEVEFKVGQEVRFASGEHQGLITGVLDRGYPQKVYLVTWAHDLKEQYHSGFELMPAPIPSVNIGFLK